MQWRLLYGLNPKELNVEIQNGTFCEGMTRAMIECEKTKLPYILLSRKEGNSWEEQLSFNNGDTLYWDSVLGEK